MRKWYFVVSRVTRPSVITAGRNEPVPNDLADNRSHLGGFRNQTTSGPPTDPVPCDRRLGSRRVVLPSGTLVNRVLRSVRFLLSPPLKEVSRIPSFCSLRYTTLEPMKEFKRLESVKKIPCLVTQNGNLGSVETPPSSFSDSGLRTTVVSLLPYRWCHDIHWTK